jgi:predicted transcriptional regulator
VTCRRFNRAWTGLISTHLGVGDELRSSTRLQVIRLPRTAEQRWSLHDPYFELVWIEPLGVTACAVARRLELLMTARSAIHATSLSALATLLHATPAKVLRSLRRLHHHGLVVWREHVGVIGLSGFARSLDATEVAALSPYSVRLHRALSTGDVDDRAHHVVDRSVAVENER